MAMFRYLALALVALSFSAQAQWQEGTHYERLPTELKVSAADDRIEVVEVFWYGCPHCYSLKPVVEAWEENLADDVSFILLPAALGRNWEPHAYAFYASEALGVFDKTHDLLFDALARDQRPLGTAESLAEFLGQHGVDEEAFIKEFNSFGVNARVQRAQSVIRGARLTGVPAMLVAGKYKTNASMAGGHQAMMNVVDYLVEKERNERSQ